MSERTRIAVRSRSRCWTDDAIRLIHADARRSADTHLLRYPLPSAWAADGPGAQVTLYLKDETTHITGSLKHRLARSLFLYALCNGWINEGTTVVEASSGSTAVSEAYFAALLGLPFVAVMPTSTSSSKVALIEAQGGRCHFVHDSGEVYAEAERVARDTGGHYLDQFTNAERATDWRGNNNIAESIFEQMGEETHPIPEWIVVGAGTGGTSATIGRYIRYRRHATRLCVVDPENSAFFPAYAEGRCDIVMSGSSRIEGIGRPRVEPSFLADVVDRMVLVPDAASVAAARHRPGAPGGALDGHQRVGRLRSARRDGGPAAQRVGGHAARRQRRPLHRHLLRRRVGQRAGNRPEWPRRGVGGVRALLPVGMSRHAAIWPADGPVR